MKRLTPREEEIMRILWKLGKGFVRDIRDQMPDPKPHANTISTLVRNLEKEGWVGHEKFGPTHRYYPLVKQESYKEKFMGEVLDHYFENSYQNLVSFFAKKKKISPEELRKIIEEIESSNE